MKFTLAPAIIVLSAGSVNKNFHYAPRGGALVQITPKFSSSILLLFSPHYNNIILKQQELVKVYYIIAGIIGNPLNYREFPRTYEEFPCTCVLFVHFAPLELGFTDAAAANRI